MTVNATRRRAGGLLRQRNFGLLWAGQTVSWAGDFMSIVAMPLLAVTVLHASDFAVGALVAAAYLPWLLVGLPAGAWIDQLPARPVMITCDVVSAVLFLSIPVSAWVGILTLGQVMVVAFLAGTASVFSVTAGQVYMPALITKAELLEGNAKLQGSESAAELAGPGVAGLVAQTLGVSAALVGNALSFLVSAACVLGTRPRTAEQPSPADQSPARRPRLRQTIADGLRFVARDPFLARMSLSSTVGNLALSGLQAVQIVFLVRVLKLPPLAVGLLVAVPGVGALFGALSARRISERIGTARGLLLAFSCAQPFCLFAPLATRGAGVVLYVAGMLIFPVGVAVANVIIASFRQAYTPPGMLGRVSATMKFLAYGGIPLGALAGGGLAATLGPRQALWIIFAVLTGSGALVFSRPFFQSRDLPASRDNAASTDNRGAGTRPLTGKRRKHNLVLWTDPAFRSPLARQCRSGACRPTGSGTAAENQLDRRTASRQGQAMAAFPVPRYLAETAAREPALRAWLSSLPQLVADLADQWSVSVGEPFEPGGQCSWTAPATGALGAALVLKLEFRFGSGEERDEAAALQAWDGNGAVRLHAASTSESFYGLLLERCLPGTPLGRVLPEPEQDVVVAGLLLTLWAQPYQPDAFRPLALMCAAWADEFEAAYAGAPPEDRIDPGLARAGIALFRELPGTAADQVLLCTDLHADNILAAGREPWLMIDPKPYTGDPAYDVLQHMLNCEDRLAADPAALADRMAQLAGLNPGLVRLWLFARSVQESVGSSLMQRVARQLAPA